MEIVRPSKPRLVVFAFGDFAFNLYWQSIMLFLLFYYTDAINLSIEVAATTWTNLLACREYKGAATLDAIRAFGKETWGKYGGEPVEAFTFTGPTAAEPDEP